MAENINESELKALIRLRNDMLTDAIDKSGIKSILSRYYPSNTLVQIHKDYWIIKKEDE